MKLSKLTTPAVMSFKDKLLGTCSQVMAAKVMVSLKSMLKHAKLRQLVAQNMATGVNVEIAPGIRGGSRSPRNEIRGIIGKTSGAWPATEPWRAMALLAIFSGLRPSEFEGLVWDHVDFDKRIVEVRERADFQGTIGSPKSEAGNRDVPLAPMVVNVLRQWKLACPKTEAGDSSFPAKRTGGVIGHLRGLAGMAANASMRSTIAAAIAFTIYDMRRPRCSSSRECSRRRSKRSWVIPSR